MKSRILALILAAATALQAQTITKISGLSELTSPATGDLFVTVDVSDISGGAAGTTKRITLGNLNTYLTSTLSFQPLDSDLTSIAALTTTSFGRGLLDDADASAGRTSLGVAIGADVQAYDADLTTYAGITPSANVQTLLGSADYSAFRTSLGVAIGADVQAYDADLTTYAGITPSANVQTLLGSADYSAFRTSLGLGTLATQNGTFSGTSSGTNTGDVSLGASLTDILDLTSQALSADDAAADKLVFWDDSGGKLTYLTLGSNLTITGTTLDATGGGASLGSDGADDGGFTGGTVGTADLSGGDASSSYNGGQGGSISLVGGDANGSHVGGDAGSITLNGSTAGMNAGSITLSGGAHGTGGSINTSNGGGNIYTYGVSGAAGGAIATYAASGAAGGAINTYGGTSAGGAINTYDGGGAINTRGAGSIQLGATGTRTTLTGEATGNRTAKFPANSSSGYIPLVASTTGIIDLSTSEVTGTLPVANGGTGITALGTGVATALGINVGSAGAPVLFNGAGGTPSSLTLTNASGLPPAGVTGTAAVITGNAFTGANTTTLTSLGTTPTAASSLVNTTAAAAGAQQVSPSIVWSGQGWKTTATAASQAVDFRAYALPVQGSTSPTGRWILAGAINGGAYTNLFSVHQSSSSQIITSLNAAGDVNFQTCIVSDPSSARYGIRFGVGLVPTTYGAAIASHLGRIGVGSGGYFTWASTGDADVEYSVDVLLGRDAAAVVQLGADANGSPVPQSLKAHDGITGSNIAGANLTTAGGLGTGTGRGGDRIEKTAESGSSGTTATSYTTREYHSAKWVDLTESSATTVCNVAVASGKYSGLVMVCTISADDATDYQTITSTVNVGAVNKAGTVTATITQVDGTTAASAGTLTVTFTAVASGNTVDIKANAVSSLTQTTLRAKWSIVSLNTNSTDTSAVAGSVVTPQ